MRFQDALALAAATAIVAVPFDAEQFEQRQASVVQAALAPVMQSLQTLDTTILLVTPDPSTAPPMLAAAGQTLQAIDGATSMIAASMPIGILSAKSLEKPVDGLVGMVQQAMGDLEAKKPILDMLGVTAAAANALAQNKIAADGLTGALVSKLPKMAMPAAQQKAAAIDMSMDNGIAVLSARSLATSSTAADLNWSEPATSSAIEAEPANEMSVSSAAGDEASSESVKAAARQIQCTT